MYLRRLSQRYRGEAAREAPRAEASVATCQTYAFVVNCQRGGL
jgi:hypothetical protein